MAIEIWVNIDQRHQAITWPNVDLSLEVSYGIHLRAFPWEYFKTPNT